ncbi:MAG: hypothetical protein AB7P99_12940 [Vicinamibacterales bacterium]
MNPSDEQRVQRAALIVLVAGSVVGAALLVSAVLFGADIEAWVRAEMAVRVRAILAVVAVLILVPGLGFAGYVWRRGGLGMRLLAVGLAVSTGLAAWLAWQLTTLLEPR